MALGAVQRVASQLGFDLFNGGQAAAEVLGQRVGKVSLPGGDGDGLVEAAEGVFGDEAVLFPAEQQADGGLVVRVPQEVVHGGEVEIELADVAWREGAGFQLDDDVAAELEVIEEKIERVVFIAHFQAHLPSDEGKAGAQLQKEFLDVIHQGPLDLRFTAWVRGAEEIEQVGIFEELRGHVGVCRRHGHREVVLRLARPEMELALDLNFRHVTAPPMGDGLADVERARVRVFDPLHDLEGVSPGQLRNRLLRNWACWELTGKNLHRQKVAHRKAAHVRECFLQVGGEAVDDSGPPTGFLLTGENDSSRVPVCLDENGIRGEDSADAGAAEMGLYLLKGGGVALGQRCGRRGHRKDGVGPRAATG